MSALDAFAQRHGVNWIEQPDGTLLTPGGVSMHVSRDGELNSLVIPPVGTPRRR
jgi:hypothetical protein